MWTEKLISYGGGVGCYLDVNQIILYGIQKEND